MGRAEGRALVVLLEEEGDGSSELDDDKEELGSSVVDGEVMLVTVLGDDSATLLVGEGSKVITLDDISPGIVEEEPSPAAVKDVAVVDVVKNGEAVGGMFEDVAGMSEDVADGVSVSLAAAVSRDEEGSEVVDGTILVATRELSVVVDEGVELGNGDALWLFPISLVVVVAVALLERGVDVVVTDSDERVEEDESDVVIAKEVVDEDEGAGGGSYPVLPIAPAGISCAFQSTQFVPLIPLCSHICWPLYGPPHLTFFPGLGKIGSTPSTVEHPLTLALATNGGG